MGRVFLWGVLAVLGGAGAWAAARFWRVMAIAAAYKAKVLASTIFGTGRAVDPGRAEEVRADSYWPMQLFRTRVDFEKRLVTVSFLGLRGRTAIFRSGLGATLAAPGAELAPRSAAAAVTAPPESAIGSVAGRGGVNAVAGEPGDATAPWAERGGALALRKVVESAFAEPDLERRRRTRAIVVVQDGRIVAERYAPEFTAETRFPGWSMTKSVLGALVGILVGEGRLSLDQQGLMPGWRAPDRRAEIRLEDLLRMRSGLRFSEVYSDVSSDVIEMLFNRPDTAAYAAGQPLEFAAGTTWSYSSGTTNILSALVRRTVGDADYFDWPRRVLFDPIGMNTALMEPDASGTFVGSSFMLATARDWGRFGQLFLQDGWWEGRRILPEGWVRFSTTPTPQSPGGIYGAHWWLGLKPELGGGTPAAARIPADAFFAVGHEGQTLTVIPSLRLVVVRLGLSIYVDAWNHAAFLAELQKAL